MAGLTLHFRPLAPFRLDLTVWVLRRRPHNLLDRWDGDTYRRVLLLSDRPVEVAVSQTGPPEEPELRVEVIDGAPEPESAASLMTILALMLGLEADLKEFYLFAAREPRLLDLVQKFRGVKPPRYPSLFEALVNAIACQQISLTAGLHLLNRLIQAFGALLANGNAEVHAFPRPRDLAGLAPQALRDIGFSFNKARTIIALSQAFLTGAAGLENLESLDDAAAVTALCRLKGIGRWSAEYALLRGLGRTHLFPGDDVGARRRLQDWLGRPEPLDYDGVSRVLAGFRPFGGLIYFHFLLSGLAAQGLLAGPGEQGP